MANSNAFSGFTPEADYGNPVTFGGGLGFDSRGDGMAFANLDVEPARVRTSRVGSGLMFAKDAFDYITGIDPNAYMGKTAKLMNDYDKIRMEEDPEGYQIDMNRAKVLSKRALETNDPALKRKYGAAIKKLLPAETQGLDDLTASTFLASSDDKLKLEQLKGYNKLQQIALQNEGKVAATEMGTAAKMSLAAQKYALQADLKQLDAQLKQAIADGKNDAALALQDKKSELQLQIHDIDNAAKLEREMEKQAAANYRAEVAANARVNAAMLGGKKAAENNMDLIGSRTSQEVIDRLKALNDTAGRWAFDATNYASSLINTEAARSYQEFEGLAKQMVQDQLRKIYGSQFTEEEGERFFRSMGLNYKMDPSVRWNLLIRQLNDLRAKAGYGPISEDGIVPPAPTPAQTNTYGTPKNTNGMVNSAGIIEL